MAEETCEIPTSGAQGRYAAEWGLASLILAGVLVLAALLALLVILLFVAVLSQLRPGRSDVQVAAIVAAILVGLFWMLTVISLVFAVVGVRAAWRRCQPGGLPLAGLIFSLFAFLLWLAVILVLVMNIVDLSRRHIL
jgi:hypothetical protein